MGCQNSRDLGAAPSPELVPVRTDARTDASAAANPSTVNDCSISFVKLLAEDSRRSQASIERAKARKDNKKSVVLESLHKSLDESEITFTNGPKELRKYEHVDLSKLNVIANK